MKRNATAVWTGTGKEGKGVLSTQSTTLNKTQYSYKSRFEEGVGTNPEELVAAAHAGCFTMALTFALNGAGFTPEELDTTCDITLESGTITKSELHTKVKLSGITPEKFQEIAAGAKANCPISKLFTCEITLEASLA